MGQTAGNLIKPLHVLNYTLGENIPRVEQLLYLAALHACWIYNLMLAGRTNIYLGK